MPARIDNAARKKAVSRWLSGETRDEIAKALNIGTGTVSSMVKDWQIGLDKSDHQTVRQLAVHAKKMELTLKDAINVSRLYNLVKQYGIKTEGIEDFLIDVNDICVQQKLASKDIMSTAKQTLAICRAEKVASPSQVADMLEQKFKELRAVKDSIQTLKIEKQKITQEKAAALKEKGITVVTLNEYIRVRNALGVRGLSISSIKRVLTMLDNCQKLDFDPGEAVSILSKIKDMKKTVENLGNKIEEVKGKIVNREVEKQKLDEEIRELEDGKKILEQQLEILHELTDAIKQIKRLKVEDRHIIAIAEILSRYWPKSIDVERLLTELEQYGSFTTINEMLAEKKVELKKEMDDLLFNIAKLQVFEETLKKNCSG